MVRYSFLSSLNVLRKLFDLANFNDDNSSSGNSSGGHPSNVLPPKKTSAHTTGWDVLVGQLEDRYLNFQKSQPGEGERDQTGEEKEEDDDELLGRNWLWLRDKDWPLWRVKCTVWSFYLKVCSYH
jgi:hypothetical protein